MSQRGSKKSRTGCLACKSKRIKCDELRPECGTCTRRGHRCPGYQKTLKWSTKYELHSGTIKSRPPGLSLEERTHDSPHASDECAFAPGSPHRNDLATMPMSFPMASGLCASNDDFINVELWESIYCSTNGFDGDFWDTSQGAECSSFRTSELTQDWSAVATDGTKSHGQWPHDFQAVNDDANLYQDSSQNADPQVLSLAATAAGEELSSAQSSLEDPSGPQVHPGSLQTHCYNETSSKATSTRSRDLHTQKHGPIIAPSLQHMPTLLIDYWFQNVCGMWNGFDSQRNMNRRVAMDKFASSEGLAYSLQSMAAAHLAENLPHFRDTAIAMTCSAIMSIQTELRKPRSSSNTLPCGLLLSMFCLGTSACWTEPLQLGLPFLKEIKAVLRVYSPSAVILSSEDLDAWAFFNSSCLYWEMLCSVVGEVAYQADDEFRGCLAISSASSRQSSGENSSVLMKIGNERTSLLHPWTGVSDEIISLFSKSISLCHRFRTHITQYTRPTSRNLKATLAIVQEAQELHHQLQRFHVPAVAKIDDTDDDLTPKSHLVQIAEAYRLASLVHLTHTFDDLDMDVDETGLDQTDAAATSNRAFCLGMEIINILEQIPVTSGSRCIQPLLCLTAGIVLDAGAAVIMPDPAAKASLSYAWSHDLKDLSSQLRPAHGGDDEPNIDGSGMQHHGIFHNVSQHAIEISKARRFILQRFNALESSLPPKPIQVAKQLVQKVWSAYDMESRVSPTAGAGQAHWIDIMTRHDLRTIFG